jgi:hypothetical protein
MTDKKWRGWIISIVKFIVTSSLLYYVFFKYIDINELLSAFDNIHPEYFFLLLFVVVANRYVLAYQTSYFFKKIFQIDLGINFVFRVQMISSFFAFILPGELAGGLISWYMFADKSGKKNDSATVIIFLRLLSIITMVAFTAIGFIFEEKLEVLGLNIYISLVIFISLLMFVPFVSSRVAYAIKHFAQIIIQLIPYGKIRNKLLKFNEDIWESVVSCSNSGPALILYAISLSVVWYLLLIIFFYMLMIMVGINLPFQVSVWLIGVITIVQYLPVSFAGLGVRDISIIYLLDKFYQIRPESSMILSTFFLIFSLIFVLMGGVATWLKPLGINQIKR